MINSDAVIVSGLFAAVFWMGWGFGRLTKRLEDWLAAQRKEGE